ncbi:MAG: hypothetical protein II612_03450 [Prevotella sp.]|nr:hypothetical protein [Prevotella sp.]
MEIKRIEKPKIEFYKRRTFSEKVTATFDFVRENWRTVFKYVTYFVLPLCLLQSVSYDSFMGSYADGFINAMGGEADQIPNLGLLAASYVGLIVCTLVAYVLVSGLTATLMMLYNERGDRLQAIEYADLRPRVWRNVGRMALVMLVSVLFSVGAIGVIIVLTMLSPYSLIATLPAGIALLIPFTLVSPVYVYERVGIWQAVAKGYRLGFASWWGVLGFILLLSIIVNIITSVAGIPFYILMMVKMVLGMEGNAPVSPLLTVGNYLSSAFLSFFSYVSMALMFIGISYLYSHMAEKVDGVTVDQGIEEFETLNTES